MFFSPPWTIKPIPVFGLSAAIAIAYWWWINYCFSYNNFYPYPLFELLDTKSRALLFGGSACVMSIVTLLLKKAYNIVNGIEGLQKASRTKKVA